MTRPPTWVDHTMQECPECGSKVKIYKRTITCSMAEALILMYKTPLAPGEYHHMPTLLDRKQHDDAKLRYWGLIEGKDETRLDGSERNGYWRLTDAGREFVLDNTTVPKYAVTYKGTLLELTGAQIGIRDALGKNFNYRELMSR